MFMICDYFLSPVYLEHQLQQQLGLMVTNEHFMNTKVTEKLFSV